MPLSIALFLRSFLHAAHGIRGFFRSERNAWVHLVAAIAVIMAGCSLRLARWEWVALALAIGLVFAAELLNTAIEQVCDLVVPQRDPRVKAIKDLAAAAVLVAALAALAVGVVVFGTRVKDLFG